MKHIFQLISLSILLACASCNGANDKNAAAVSAEADMLEAAPLSVDKAIDTLSNESERKLTKTGRIRFESKNLSKTHQFIQQTTAEFKGYIAEESSSQSSGRTENTTFVRIPAESFDLFLQKIESQSAHLDYKNISVEDVTEEYIDLETRIRTKKEVEAKYQELLKRAANVEEIMKIEEQIGNIRSEIESAEGRFRYLSKQVQYSSLTITYYDKVSHFGFWNKIGKAFQSGWNNLLWLLVGVVNMWAIILFIILIWIIIAYIIKRNKVKHT